MGRKMPSHRRAFTLVELLIAIAVISVLIALLVPAIQAAREAGRRAICQNNLKQIGTALSLHVAINGRYPTGGWGHEWIGIAGRGSRDRQPGSWVFCILPNLELNDLYLLGLNQGGSVAEEEMSRMLGTPLPVFTCPTRRRCAAWEVASLYGYAGSPKPFGHAERVARSDYAINGGSSHALSFPGPPTIEIGDDHDFWKDKTYVKEFSGVSHLRTGARLSTFDDGLSKTYLVGEKMIDQEKYENGLSIGDNDSIYSGFSNDLHRYAGLAGSSSPWLPPLADGNENINPKGYIRFGSAHNGFLMAHCDGAVRFVDFDIDPEVHFRAGHRRDGGIAVDQLK
jgi:prepilin-type N-terminal cleavage/methylation domain-containing protein